MPHDLPATLVRRAPLARAALAGLLTLVLPLATAHAAGQAQVSFPGAADYADAGSGIVERERTQATLAAHFARLAQRLPTGHSLQVQMLDIDLAGELQPFWPGQVRVMGQVPDGPRLHLHYELRDGARVLARGQARLADPGYLWRVTRFNEHGALHHERRLLDAWFDEHIASAVAVR